MLPTTHCAKPSHHHWFSRIAASFGALALAVPGAAEESADDDRVYETIIVTAEKREEDILSVPITMTAFSQDMLEELGMTGDEDLEQLVPGLQFAYDSEGNGITIRGIGTQKAVQYNADLAVAFYVDGVYTNDVYGLAPNLFDVERVEVARGPQGTLNGRNSIAGAVSYVNRKPSDDWDAQVLVEFTDTVTQRYNAAWGGPLTDEVSFRLTGGYYEGDGWQENTGIGGNYAAPDQYTLAPQLRYTTDRVDINLRRQVARDQGTSRAPVRMVDVDRESPTYLLGGIWPVTNFLYLYEKPLPGIANCDPRQFRERGGFCEELENKVLSNRSSIQDNETDRWSLNADVDVGDLLGGESGALTVRYTYGSTVTDTVGSRDGDNTDRVPSAEDRFVPQDCVDQLGVTECRERGVRFQDRETAFFWDNDESSHELQLFSNFDGPFNFVAGAYAYENESHWRVKGGDYANPFNFTSAEDAVARIDRDEDGAPDYANCEEFYQTYVLGPDDPATEIIEGRSLSPAEYQGCEPGDNHLLKGGSASGAGYETRAVFANGEYELTDQWRVSGGLRWTEDKKDQRGVSGTFGVANVLGVPITRFRGLSNRNDSWGGTIGHVSLEFTPADNRLYYGRISTGFRAGGFNQISGGTSAADIANNIVPATFEEETLVNYEAGLKGRFLDDRLVLQTGAYLQVFDGFHFNGRQLISEAHRGNRASPILEYTANVDGTEIWGAEVEWAFYATDQFRISGYYNYLDSSLGSHMAYIDGDRDGDTLGTFIHSWIDEETGQRMQTELTNMRDNTGNRLPQMPNHKGAVTLAYTQPLETAGTVEGLVTWSYTGSRYPSIGNLGYRVLPAYSRVDVRTTWQSADEVWAVTGYVQNLLDEIGIQEYAFDWGWLTEPRQMGIQVRYRPQL